MGTVRIDSNVRLDIFTFDPTWFEWSSDALANAAESHELIINAIIYAQVSISFATIQEMDSTLPLTWVARHAIPEDAAFLAGKCFATYRRRGGQKRSPLPDFFIKAHASVTQMALLTRDATPCRTYFPRLRLITPE